MTRRQKTVARILELKEFTKEQLEAEARTARQLLHAEEERLAQLEQEHQSRSDELSRKQDARSIEVHELDLYYTYLKHIQTLIGHQKGIVAVRAAELEEVQRAMVEAYQEQRLLEKLQDRLRHAQEKETRQEEQKQADYQYLTRKGLK